MKENSSNRKQNKIQKKEKNIYDTQHLNVQTYLITSDNSLHSQVIIDGFRVGSSTYTSHASISGNGQGVVLLWSKIWWSAVGVIAEIGIPRLKSGHPHDLAIFYIKKKIKILTVCTELGSLSQLLYISST